MFKEDFEFAEGHMSHLHTAPSQELKSPESAIAPTNSIASSSQVVLTPLDQEVEGITWSADGEAELKKIPFFVRGKIKRNTEKFASDRGINSITVDTLYEAKAAIGK